MAEAGYLDKLNDDQRAAVKFGVGGDALSPPPLVIAGAGCVPDAQTGKRTRRGQTDRHCL
ncbi:MAG: hypothetical protein R6V26_04800 [Roseovarius sp.]